ncbi:MAG: hypothetical protein KDB22_15730 [Planctomycetales bacterium]|nr:hypothetical protein [Planctomycetales bacterium]
MTTRILNLQSRLFAARRFRTAGFCAAAICCSFNSAMAQRGGFGGRGGPGGGPEGMFRMLPVMAALDADGNGEISAEEISGSVAALKKLDKNMDGKLASDELRPDFDRFGPAAGGREEQRGPLTRIFEFDKNGDGQLTIEELPEPMQRLMERVDKNADGVATKEEIESVIATMGSNDRGRGPGGAGEGFGRGRREGEGEAGRGGPRGAMGPGGPPAQMIERAFEFDADKDGKLSKEELAKMFEGLGRGRIEGEGGDRPRRPTAD